MVAHECEVLAEVVHEQHTMLLVACLHCLGLIPQFALPWESKH